VQFPRQSEPSEFVPWFASSLSVRLVGKGGNRTKAPLVAVMQGRIDRRISVDLSLEDLLPTWSLLVLDAEHLDVASRTFRDRWLDAFGRLDRLGTSTRQ